MTEADPFIAAQKPKTVVRDARCPMCKGMGTIEYQAVIDGDSPLGVICNHCGGRGIIEVECVAP